MKTENLKLNPTVVWQIQMWIGILWDSCIQYYFVGRSIP